MYTFPTTWTHNTFDIYLWKVLEIIIFAFAQNVSQNSQLENLGKINYYTKKEKKKEIQHRSCSF